MVKSMLDRPDRVLISFVKLNCVAIFALNLVKCKYYISVCIVAPNMYEHM